MKINGLALRKSDFVEESCFYYIIENLGKLKEDEGAEDFKQVDIMFDPENISVDLSKEED